MDYSQFFRVATGLAPFAFQRRLAEVGLPDRLAVPTGFGKTEAGVLAWLWRRTTCPETNVRQSTPSRLVYCLPMRVLVEQTAERVRAAGKRLSDAGVLPAPLEVHTLLGGAVQRDWEGNPDRPVILIGTQDQLLSRALNRGYGMSRYLWPVHFALLNNDCQWILDEVQLMGVGLSTSVQLQAFRQGFKTYGNARSMWMSATLDAGRLDTIDARGRTWSDAKVESADFADPVLKARWTAAKPVRRATASGKDASACAREVADAHVPGTLTLVVVNRVQRAQQLFQALSPLMPKEPVRVLHARFRPAERGAIQKEILAAGWSGILVATQAIEAGVDLSARTLFTDVAPWSSLVQRFGRLNRRGEWNEDQASARWFDLPADDEEAALPYSVEELAEARSRIMKCSDVGPSSLADIETPGAAATLPVVRRRDLLQLFDTEPDLAGHDLDVSPYIRGTKDTDVQVAWRAWEGDAPPADAPEIAREELCTVSLPALLNLAKGQVRPWRWSGVNGKWERVTRVVPGMVLVVPISFGGYDPLIGWTGERSDVPTTVAVEGPAPDSDEADTYTFDCSRFVSLTEHASDAADEITRLKSAMPHLDLPWETLSKAARWHDLGKAHEVFQAMLFHALDPSDPRRLQGPWAKSDGHGGRVTRPHFRHELASALALLNQGGTDIEVYLVAAHHGKVRVTLRARPGEREPRGGQLFALGVWDGDSLPQVDLGAGTVVPSTVLSLSCMQIGGQSDQRSWLDRMAGLLESQGPFQLAFLEALVRIADWRATSRHQQTTTKEHVHV
ncbi:MAG: DEAD/DEAH box helicase [Planctomycetes bacterium]|nr:DEAD/DEAH box helicase [Planctomycetota bacterium]